MKSTLALFGNVSLQRGYCRACKETVFIRDGHFSCCGTSVESSPKSFVRVSEPYYKRKTPTANEKQRILNAQENRCFYCGVRFGAYRTRHGKPVLIKVNWDHKLPFAYSQNNKTSNFVAACHVCNGIKSSHIFKTVSEAQVYLKDIRRKKGYDF